MNESSSIDVGLAEQAVAIVSGMEEGEVTSEEAFAFLRKSPEHVGEVLMMAGLLESMKHLSPGARAEIDAILEIPESPDAEPSSLQDSIWAKIQRPLAPVVAALACFALIAAIAVGVNFMPSQPQYYETGIGGFQRIALSDGSTLEMNTRSEVLVHESSGAREVRVLVGEVRCNVEHDSSRPFTVRAGVTLIRSIGTSFNVYHTGDHTDVAVAAGAVEIFISPSELAPKSMTVSAGQGMRIHPNGDVNELQESDRINAFGWQQKRLVFRNIQLGRVASEFNRYNELQLRVEGRAAERVTSGVFSANSPESVVDVLAVDPTLEIERRPEIITIRNREL
jgi:transmembrane sensor